MARVVNFSAWRRNRVTIPTSQREHLRLQDAANLIEALTIVTEAREAFLKFADEAQTPAVLVTFVHLTHELDRSGAEIRRLIRQKGDADPPCCE